MISTPRRGPLTTEQISFLQSVDSPTISNAIERFTVRDRTEGFIGGAVRSLFPELGVMVGSAVTVTVANPRGRAVSADPFWRMWDAVREIGGPVVLVLQDISGAPTRCAQFGEVMATIARRLGVVGVVTDGGVRDLAEVKALGLHYFAPYAVASHGNSEILEIGLPVTIDGQVVRTGDILHGDLNGVVVVPHEILDQLPPIVDDVRANEHRQLELIKGPDFTLAAYRGLLEGARRGVGH